MLLKYVPPMVKSGNIAQALDTLFSPLPRQRSDMIRNLKCYVWYNYREINYLS